MQDACGTFRFGQREPSVGPLHWDPPSDPSVGPLWETLVWPPSVWPPSVWDPSVWDPSVWAPSVGPLQVGPSVGTQTRCFFVARSFTTSLTASRICEST